MKILVAYSSKYGGTEQIAQTLGEVLRTAGLQAEVLDVGELGSLDGYEAVVLGSAVYMGQWRKEAAAFLRANVEALARRPVWLFSSGPTGEGDPVELMSGFRFPKDLAPLAERIRPRAIAFFHGVLDTQKISLAERMVVKGVKAPVGDFRDWDQIRAWGMSIAKDLDQSPT